MDDLGRRLRDAKRDYEQRHDVDLTWVELGKRIGAALGRKPIKYQVVQRWFLEGREPAEFVTTIAAIARVLEADPGALAFGGPIRSAPTDEGRGEQFERDVAEAVKEKRRGDGGREQKPA